MLRLCLGYLKHYHLYAVPYATDSFLFIQSKSKEKVHNTSKEQSNSQDTQTQAPSAETRVDDPTQCHTMTPITSNPDHVCKACLSCLFADVTQTASGFSQTGGLPLREISNMNSTSK